MSTAETQSKPRRLPYSSIGAESRRYLSAVRPPRSKRRRPVSIERKAPPFVAPPPQAPPLLRPPRNAVGRCCRRSSSRVPPRRSLPPSNRSRFALFVGNHAVMLLKLSERILIRRR